MSGVFPEKAQKKGKICIFSKNNRFDTIRGPGEPDQKTLD
jgi:hypothetical protein